MNMNLWYHDDARSKNSYWSGNSVGWAVVVGFLILGCRGENGNSRSVQTDPEDQMVENQTIGVRSNPQSGRPVEQVPQGEDGKSSTGRAASQVAPVSAGPPATREDLQAYLDRFKSSDTWHFGERVPGELVGTWRTVKRRDQPVLFRADGSYSQDFNGNRAEGLYAISDSGKVVAFSKWKGTGLGAHYQLRGQHLVGPRGPIPNERWQREAEMRPPCD